MRLFALFFATLGLGEGACAVNQAPAGGSLHSPPASRPPGTAVFKCLVMMQSTDVAMRGHCRCRILPIIFSTYHFNPNQSMQTA